MLTAVTVDGAARDSVVCRGSMSQEIILRTVEINEPRGSGRVARTTRLVEVEFIELRRQQQGGSCHPTPGEVAAVAARG